MINPGNSPQANNLQSSAIQFVFNVHSSRRDSLIQDGGEVVDTLTTFTTLFVEQPDSSHYLSQFSQLTLLRRLII